MHCKDTTGSGNNSAKIDPTVAEQRLRSQLHDALQNEENCLIEAPTGLGKSYSVATTNWLDLPKLTGEQPVLHISQTRAARDDAAEHSKKAGIRFTVLESRQDLCGVAAGEFDDVLPEIDDLPTSEWLDRKCDLEHVPFSQAYKHLRDRLGDLPCTTDGVCAGEARWENVPRDKEGNPSFDVIHATANFLHVPALVDQTNIIIDEQPDFGTSFDQENLRRVANRLLRENSNGGYLWEGLMHAIRARDQSILTDFHAILDDARGRFRWQVSDDNVDTLAPGILRAIAVAQPSGDDYLTGMAGRTGVIIDPKNTIIRVLHVPDLSQARCVIGLDAHPSPLRWQLETRLQLPVQHILSSEEGQLWRVNQRCLEVIQIGTNTNSFTLGWRGKGKETANLLIHAIRDEHGSAFRTCICPKKVEDDVEDMMERAGIEDPELMHFGDTKSRNDFDGERVGLILGCIDPGDNTVLTNLGLLGLQAKPEKYPDGSRKHGRKFTGPDADAAAELLESIRATNVVQAVGRYARDVRDPDDHATVYVWTDVLPDDWIDSKVSISATKVTELMEEIESEVKATADWTTALDIANELGRPKGSILRILNRMADQGIVCREKETGPEGADRYRYLAGSLQPTISLEIED